MAQWADYGISAVRYGNSGSAITAVRAHRLAIGNAVGTGIEMTVDSILVELRKGTTFITIVSNQGVWRKGASVIPDGQGHIRTEGNASYGDNLSNLPRL